LCLAAAPLLAFGCASARYSTEPGSPTLVVPAHFAEGKAQPASASATPAPSVASASAAPSASSAPAITPSTQPDPPPLRLAEQVEYALELNEGKLRVVSVKAVKLAAPVVTPRRLGRYAIELSIGRELIDRVRFDFPGTAADDPQLGPKKPLFAPLTLAARAIAHISVQLPQSPRVRRAVLVDRATNTATELEWPLPEIAKAPPAASVSAAPP
jgi:hypothetical protein